MSLSHRLEIEVRRWLAGAPIFVFVRWLAWIPLLMTPAVAALLGVAFIRRRSKPTEEIDRHLSDSTRIAWINLASSVLFWIVLNRMMAGAVADLLGTALAFLRWHLSSTENVLSAPGMLKI